MEQIENGMCIDAIWEKYENRKSEEEWDAYMEHELDEMRGK